MGRGGKNLILGIVIGVAATVLVLRIKEIREEEDPEILLERLSEKLDALEQGDD